LTKLLSDPLQIRTNKNNVINDVQRKKIVFDRHVVSSGGGAPAVIFRRRCGAIGAAV
jgi:hypothetical protein